MSVVHDTVRRLGQRETPSADRAAFNAAAATDLLLLYVQQMRRLPKGQSIMNETDQMVRTAQFRVMKNKNVLYAVKRAMEPAGVRWIVVKGPVLAARFYPTEWARQYNDLDVVVHPDDLEDALDALIGMGATMLDRNWEMIARKRQGEVSLVYGETLIDLHWHFYSSPSIRRRCHVDMRAVVERRRNLSVSGLSLPIMEDLDGLVFLATHAILSGGHKARWMVDFAFAFESIKPDPGLLFERARTHAAALQLAVMIRRVEMSLEVVLCQSRQFLTTPERLWLVICSLTSRLAPIENDLAGTLSGRAVISATRDRLWPSISAATRNVVDAIRARRGRRYGTEIDRTLLHNPGGTVREREAWLRVAAAEGGGDPPARV